MEHKELVNPSTHTDVEFIEGLKRRDPRIEKDFYIYCKRYFHEHHRAVFFTTEGKEEDIFQNSFISLWQNIEREKIYVSRGMILCSNGKPLECTLTTYLMSIARNKYLELARSASSDDCLTQLPSEDSENYDDNLVTDWMEEDYEKAMYEVISDSISVMPQSCSQLLTKFYFENKKLDDMLEEIPEYSSKDAIKSNKNRCLNRLKMYAKQLYKIRKSN